MVDFDKPIDEMVALWVNRDVKDLLDEQLERLLLDNECRDLDELSKLYHCATGYEVVDRREILRIFGRCIPQV